jgi:hypothetical protein
MMLRVDCDGVVVNILSMIERFMTIGIPDLASGERGAENALEAQLNFKILDKVEFKYSNGIRNLNTPPKVTYY